MSKVQQRKQLRASTKEARGDMSVAAPLHRIGGRINKGNFELYTRKGMDGVVQTFQRQRRFKATKHNGIVFGLSTPLRHGNSNSLQGLREAIGG